MKIESYRQLQVWQKAVRLVTEVYRISRVFPKEETFGLTSQTRRAAVSVPANIAEGWGRNMSREYVQFLRVARGSLLELETHLEIARNLGYLGNPMHEMLLEKTQELNKMLNSMIQALSKSMTKDE